MKRAALYMRVSTLDQHPETQLYDLRQMAQQRGYEIVEEYTDRVSGARARRPGLDALMRDARRNRFDVLLVWASDRIARSVRHFLDVLDELNRLNIEFISFREQIDTWRSAGPGHRGHHRSHRGTGTQPHHRAGTCRHAPRTARRSAHRPAFPRARSSRHPAGPAARPESRPAGPKLPRLPHHYLPRAP